MFPSGQDVFEILSEAIPEGLLIVDDSQTIVSVNSSCLRIFGYEKMALIGQKLSLLIPNRYHAAHGSHFKNYFENSDRREMGKGRDLQGVKKCGSEFPIEVGLAPFEVYGKKIVLALIVDITLRKETENKILELNERLEDKIKIRTLELHDTIAELEKEVDKRKIAEAQALESLKKEKELNELKTKFLSMVSHEFKTPLTGILTSTRLATKYIETGNTGKQKKHLDTIANKVHYLNDILNDFLSVERFESGKVQYNFTHFELSKVLNEVIYDSNMLLKSGQSINYPENSDEFSLYFDQKILELVLFNLIRNAIKYSPEDTTIDLTLKEKNGKLIFTVTDQGIGIPDNDQKHIFERYFRAQNATLDQGTGIGLNIVKGHVESLGGSIYFTSKENVGSKFTVEIPLNKIYNMTKKVLLIEDDPVLRENTAELLELSNYDVETAANGKTGLAKAIETLPDVIVCDIMMPELDGYGVLEGLSHNERTQMIPFIFLSARTEHKDVRKGMDLGADDYLTKPFEENELISAIESRIAKASILKEHNKDATPFNVNFNTRQGTLKSLDDLRAYFDKEGDYDEFEAGEEIYSETTNSNYLYLVDKGVIKNHRLDEYGKELITGLFNKGDFFGYTSFAYNSPNPEGATALETSGVLKVSKDRIKDLLEENHDVTLELINYITDSLSEAKEQLLQMAYGSVRKKTANTIIKFVDKLKDRQQDGIRISRSDLAGVAGIATESLIRALSSLKKEGLIEIEGRTIKVLNANGLAHVE